MSLEDDEGPEEAEQIIEFVYDIVKDYPTGITSAFLEEQYDKRFVQCGIARKLPKNWLRYVKMADEFEVRQVSTFTMLYIVSKDTIPKLPVLSDLTIDHSKVDPANEVVQISKGPASEITTKQESVKTVPSIPPPKVELQPWSPSSMPTSTTHVHILSATDPDNISFRLCSWDPMPDYLYTALQRDLNESQSLPLSPSDIAEGLVLAAKISDASWERVKVVRRSKNPAYWVVYAVDVGFFHLVHESDFRPLTEAVHAFNKVFLAKCK
ncbi:tudor domain-containing protein, partial [Aphelenchoides avenae]